MKKVKKILFAVIFVAIFLCICSLTNNVKAAIKENSSSFSGDTYIIGSTKFNQGFVITASRAAIAGANEAYMRYMIYGNFEFDTSEIKTYYYCEFDGSWNEVNMENGSLRELSQEETEELENNLNVFFVNNKEKTIEVPFNGTVDEDSIEGTGNGEAEVKNNKIIIPASWVVNGFSFTSNGNIVDVTLSNSSSGKDLEELEEPIIKVWPETTFTIAKDSCYTDEAVEFTLAIKANDYEGEKITGNIYAEGNNNVVKSLEYYNENTNDWEIVTNFTKILERNLKTETIKGRITFSQPGKYSINAYINGDNLYDAKSYEIDVKVNSKYVAKINTKYYENLQDAIKEAANTTVTLLKNVTISTDIEIDKTVDLELNGKTITIEGNDTRITAKDNANLTISNGTITSEGYGALRATGNAILNVDSDVTINVVWYGITARENATVNYSGVINVSSDGFGISGNGEDRETSTTINITGGEINAPKGYALYLPQNGTTKIDDGEFTANTVIGILSGTLEINDGTFTSNGTYKEVSIPTSNGMKPTGDTIFAEINKGYKGNIYINIKGGTLTSKNGNIIREYNTTSGEESKLPGATIKGNYTTKTILNDNISVYKATSDADFEADGTKYSVNNFIDVATNSANVKLLKDITIKERLNLEKNITLDLGGKTITIDGERDENNTLVGRNNRIDAKGTNNTVTIKNGSIVSNGDYALQAQNGAKLIIEDNVEITTGIYGLTIWDKASVDFKGKLTVTGEDGYGISGNGNDLTQNTTLNIIGGSISVPQGVAIYLPQNGTTNIKGGKITGKTVIGILSGTLNIEGGTLTAKGEKVKDENLPITTDGLKSTGDAIFVELNDSYFGNVVVNYIGGSIISASDLLREYSVNGKHATITGLTAKSGGNGNITIYSSF